MKYYIVKNSLDPMIIGSSFPQAWDFIKGYNPESPNGIFKIYDYPTSFPNFIPNLDGIKLSGKAKVTDFISSSFDADILSLNAKKILESYNLCPHRFYLLGLYIKKNRFDYYYFCERSDYSTFIDYKKSILIEYDISTSKKGDIIPITSLNDLKEKKGIIKKSKGISHTIWAEKIVLNENFDKNLDYFIVNKIDSNKYISERLMNAILENKLIGWTFTPAKNLFFE